MLNQNSHDEWLIVDKQPSPEMAVSITNDRQVKGTKSLSQLTPNRRHPKNKSKREIAGGVRKKDQHQGKEDSVLLGTTSPIDYVEPGQTSLEQKSVTSAIPENNLTSDVTWPRCMGLPVSSAKPNETGELSPESERDQNSGWNTKGYNFIMPTNGDAEYTQESKARPQKETVAQAEGDIFDKVSGIEAETNCLSSERNGGDEVSFEGASVVIEVDRTEKPRLSEELVATNCKLDYDVSEVSDESARFEIKSNSSGVEQLENDQVVYSEGAHSLVAPELELDKENGLIIDDPCHIEVKTDSTIHHRVEIKKTVRWEDEEKEKMSYKNQQTPRNIVDEYKTRSVSMSEVDASKPRIIIGDEKENFPVGEDSKLCKDNPMNIVEELPSGIQNDSDSYSRSLMSKVGTSAMVGGSLLYFLLTMDKRH